MKLTDMAIVFQLFFMCLVTVLHVKSANLHVRQINEIMYDNVIDGIVEDSLQAGYTSVDAMGQPVVELSNIKNCFEAQIRLYEAGSTYILMYVDYDGFYIWNSNSSDSWSEKMMFSESSGTPHMQKICEITDYMELQLGVVLDIPYNSGESFMNTIDDFSLIALSFNQSFDISSFSGAKIHKK